MFSLRYYETYLNQVLWISTGEKQHSFKLAARDAKITTQIKVNSREKSKVREDS